MLDPSDQRPLKGVRRTWRQRVASGGRIAAAATRIAARNAVGMHGRVDAEIGAALASELDQMKGMAMKVGQILSYFDGALPEGTHEALRCLQVGTRAVEFSEISPQFESLGKPLADLYDDFDPVPVAAASIGQVYKARYRGVPVAIKVQYPGVRDTIESDFSGLDKLSRIAALATAVDGPALVRELAHRFAEECDYRREAEHQQSFSRSFASDGEISIPRVIEERSSDLVLTTEWSDGLDFYSFAATAGARERNRAAKVLARFAYRSLFEFGVLNADPHPGNYTMAPDGTVTFLDFGCVRHFTSEFLEPERALARVIIDGRRERFRDAVMATGMIPRPERFDFDYHWMMLSHVLAPYSAPHFRFDVAYVRHGMDYCRPGNPNLRRLAIPPQWIWLQRVQWGLHAVLARLRAQGDFREIFRAALGD